MRWSSESFWDLLPQAKLLIESLLTFSVFPQKHCSLWKGPAIEWHIMKVPAQVLVALAQPGSPDQLEEQVFE